MKKKWGNWLTQVHLEKWPFKRCVFGAGTGIRPGMHSTGVVLTLDSPFSRHTWPTERLTWMHLLDQQKDQTRTRLQFTHTYTHTHTLQNSTDRSRRLQQYHSMFNSNHEHSRSSISTSPHKLQMNKSYNSVVEQLGLYWLITRSSADADNMLDAFSGQSRSTNIVPFHMLHIVCYCAIVTCL